MTSISRGMRRGRPHRPRGVGAGPRARRRPRTARAQHVTLLNVKRWIASMATWAGTTYPGRLIAAFGSSHAGNYASGLAFNAFLSMFPLILGLLAILGFATQAPSTKSSVLNAILGFFPQSAHDELVKTFTGVRRNSGLFGIIGLVGLLWSGGSLFTSMEF